MIFESSPNRPGQSSSFCSSSIIRIVFVVRVGPSESYFLFPHMKITERSESRVQSAEWSVLYVCADKNPSQLSLLACRYWYHNCQPAIAFPKNIPDFRISLWQITTSATSAANNATATTNAITSTVTTPNAPATNAAYSTGKFCLAIDLLSLEKIFCAKDCQCYVHLKTTISSLSMNTATILCASTLEHCSRWCHLFLMELTCKHQKSDTSQPLCCMLLTWPSNILQRLWLALSDCACPSLQGREAFNDY